MSIVKGAALQSRQSARLFLQSSESGPPPHTHESRYCVMQQKSEDQRNVVFCPLYNDHLITFLRVYLMHVISFYTPTFKAFFNYVNWQIFNLPAYILYEHDEE